MNRDKQEPRKYNKPLRPTFFHFYFSPLYLRLHTRRRKLPSDYFLYISLPPSPPPPPPLSSKIMEAYQRGRYRALPLIATPLEQERGHGQHHGNPSEGSLHQEKDLKSGAIIGEIAVIRRDTPAFREKEEASTIELFYDLFFVANLTSFTNVHAIDDRTSKSLSPSSLHQVIRNKETSLYILNQSRQP